MASSVTGVRVKGGTRLARQDSTMSERCVQPPNVGGSFQEHWGLELHMASSSSQVLQGLGVPPQLRIHAQEGSASHAERDEYLLWQAPPSSRQSEPVHRQVSGPSSQETGSVLPAHPPLVQAPVFSEQPTMASHWSSLAMQSGIVPEQ